MDDDKAFWPDGAPDYRFYDDDAGVWISNPYQDVVRWEGVCNTKNSDAKKQLCSRAHSSHEEMYRDDWLSMGVSSPPQWVKGYVAPGGAPITAPADLLACSRPPPPPPPPPLSLHFTGAHPNPSPLPSLRLLLCALRTQGASSFVRVKTVLVPPVETTAELAAGSSTAVMPEVLPCNETWNVDNLATLDFANTASVLFNLQTRFNLDWIHTEAGPKTLLCVNPYASIDNWYRTGYGIFDKWVMESYKNRVQKAELSNLPLTDQHRFALPPHLFGSASAALAELSQNRDMPVAIVTSGVSGSGKSFAARHLMRFFAFASSASAAATYGDADVSLAIAESDPILSGAAAGLGKLGRVEAMLLHCETVFAAFGHAKVGESANASRLLRQTKLFLGASGMIEDVELTALYFDASRVNGFESRSDAQRNYHVFYMLNAGLSPAERGACQMAADGIAAYDALTRGEASIEARNERVEFDALENALEALGVNAPRRREIYRALVAVLSLSNVEFRGADVPSLDGPSSEALAVAAQLLGLGSVDELRTQLACKMVGRDGAMKTRNRKPAEANLCVEKLVQALYMRIAAQLTNEMQVALRGACATAWSGREAGKTLENELFVSIVDTAGFESLNEGANRFEQLLANYTAEKMRHLCDELVIKRPFQLYDAELDKSPVAVSGSPAWSPLFGDARTGEGGRFPWQSNVIALELLEKGLQPIGLLEQIENSAQYARVTTEKLRTDIQTQTGATVPWGQLLTWPRQSFSANLDFGVRHTWSEVTYSVGDAQDVSQTLSFIEAGKGEYSTVLRGVKALLGDASTNTFVRDAFATCVTGTVGSAATRPAGPPFFGKRFKTELNSICRSIKLCDVQWVHCLAPNTINRPQFFESNHVAAQLRALGVSQAIRAQQAGYAHTMPYLDFYADNVLSCPQLAKKYGMNPPATLLPQLCQQMVNLLILDMPELVERPLNGPNSIVQYGATKVFCKEVLLQGLRRVKDRKLLEMNKASIRLQASWKMAKEKKKLTSLYKGYTKLQAMARGNKDRRRVNSQLQAVMRVQEAVAIFISRQNFLLMRDAASRIQSSFKRFLARRSFLKVRRMVYVTHWLARGLLLRCKILRYLDAITIVQRTVRVFLVRHRFKWHQIKAAMLIQSVFRGYGGRNHMPEMMEYLQIKKEERYRELLIRSLFATYKASVMRSRFDQMRGAAYRLQAEFKARYQKRRYVRFVKDVVTCQRVARVYVSKRILNRLRSAALVLRERWKVSKMREEEVLALQKYTAAVEAGWLKEVADSGGDESKVASSRIGARANAKSGSRRAILMRGQGRGGGRSAASSGNSAPSSVAPERFAKLKVVDMDMSSDTSDVYPGGWVAKLASLEKIATSKGQSLVQIKVGGHHSMGLTDAGECYAWGWGDRGQLGTGGWKNVSAPTLISKLLFAEANKTSTPVFISSIRCGADHTLALSDIGQVFSWGGGSRGQLGHGAGVDICSPRPIETFRRRVAMIGCGAFHSVAVTANGSLFCWGGGANQVAGARVSQSSRRGGGGGGGGAGGATRRLTQDQKTALESEKLLAQLKRLDLGTLKRELGARRLSTIGNRRALQKRLRPALQDEASLGRALREGDVAVPTPVAVGRSVVTAIAVGSDFTLALDSSALVWAWGANNYGQLGQGDLTPRSTPVALSSLRSASARDPVIAISAGLHHAAAVTTDGTLWTWGSNDCGQLGLGDTQLRSAPHHVRGERDEIVRTGARFCNVSCAERQTFALTHGRVLWEIGGHYGVAETVAADQERGISTMAASALGDGLAMLGGQAPPMSASPRPMSDYVQRMIGCDAGGVDCGFAKGLAFTTVTYARTTINERTAAEATEALKRMRSASTGPARERQVLRTQARRLLADAGAPRALYPQTEEDIARSESAMYGGGAPEMNEDDLEGLSDIELLTLVTQLQDGQGPALRAPVSSPTRGGGMGSSPRRASPSRDSPGGRGGSSPSRASPADRQRESGWNRTTRVAASPGGSAASRVAAGTAPTKTSDIVELLRQALSPAQWAALTVVDKQALARAHGIHISAIDRIQAEVEEQFSGVGSQGGMAGAGRRRRINAAMASLLRAYRRNGRFAEDCFDYTDDGCLAPTEIARGLKRLGIFATTPQLDRLFDALGLSESDTIDRNGFIAMLPRELRGQVRSPAKGAQQQPYVLRNDRNTVDVNGLFAPTLLTATERMNGTGESYIPPPPASFGQGSGLTVQDMLRGDDAPPPPPGMDAQYGSSYGGSPQHQQRSPQQSGRGSKMVQLFRKHQGTPSPSRVVKARGSARKSRDVFNTSPDKVRLVVDPPRLSAPPGCCTSSSSLPPLSHAHLSSSSSSSSLLQRRRSEVQRSIDAEMERSRRHQAARVSAQQQQRDLLTSLDDQEMLSSRCATTSLPDTPPSPFFLRAMHASSPVFIHTPLTHNSFALPPLSLPPAATSINWSASTSSRSRRRRAGCT